MLTEAQLRAAFPNTRFAFFDHVTKGAPVTAGGFANTDEARLATLGTWTIRDVELKVFWCGQDRGLLEWSRFPDADTKQEYLLTVQPQITRAATEYLEILGDAAVVTPL